VSAWIHQVGRASDNRAAQWLSEAVRAQNWTIEKVFPIRGIDQRR
jgi:hypothetical protein